MNIGVDDFSLKHTLESGQFFRFKKQGNWYYCQERDKAFKVRQEGKKLYFEGTNEKHIRRLFGLDQDYASIIRQLEKDQVLKKAIQHCRGLRVMQRDPWETLVSFQCSIMSNIKKIQLNMDKLAEAFGQKKGNFYTFPEPGKIYNIEKIKKCATGFRAKYIHHANNMVSDAYFSKLKKLPYEKAHEKLMEIPGVAEKVADCVCLFSLDKTEAFPVDVWIARIMTQHYFDEKNTKIKDIRKFAQQKWGKNAGYAQQFLYHWGRTQ